MYCMAKSWRARDAELAATLQQRPQTRICCLLASSGGLVWRLGSLRAGRREKGEKAALGGRAHGRRPAL